MNKSFFKTKAQTLSSLKGRLKTAKIVQLYFFNLGEWLKSKEKCIYNIKKHFGNKSLIIRSSCNSEDNFDTSNAGKFLSILDVNENNLENSIQSVFDSYQFENFDDEVLIQPMLENVFLSGVVFSHDPSNSSQYRIFNWHYGSDTTAVTSGKNAYSWVQANSNKINLPKELLLASDLLDELLDLFNKNPIDFEFALTKNESIEIWLLQARPLILKGKLIDLEAHTTKLEKLEKRLIREFYPNPFLMGSKTIFGVMPDWNPAEMIGLKPKPLALSLYKELITDSIWAYQRNNYGYKNLRGFPLLLDFYGIPYIDVRVSFNSFIPADLKPEISNKLVNYYIDQLNNKPWLHDKVEFEIIFSCYTFDLEGKLANLENFGFNKLEINQIFNSLLKLTNNIINPSEGLWKIDAKKIEILKQRRKIIENSKKDNQFKIYWLIEDCKRYGTLPFAGLARACFIAIQILNSLEKNDIFNSNSKEQFLRSIPTIATEMGIDFRNLSRNDFLQKYGHLRPGTYEISNERYDENPDLYFNWEDFKENDEKIYPFDFESIDLKKLDSLITKSGLKTSAKELLNFLISAIQLREYSKFEFSKNVSNTLNYIKNIGNKLEIEVEELSFTNINDFIDINRSLKENREILKKSIYLGKKQFNQAQKINLPPVISNPSDIWGYKRLKAEPNYITQKSVTAQICKAEIKSSLKGKIVFIPSADPGFDWIFSKDISGLITMWGGSNSHMAIRSGELQIPAVIGCGEDLYLFWSKYSKIQIDCLSRKVNIIE